ncbi:hypothetical protein AHF37_10686 [Paragonimus kellicotti]|nr:hypothetical protein AHF37_10686 [Paragonimus kellicotti]
MEQSYAQQLNQARLWIGQSDGPGGVSFSLVRCMRCVRTLSHFGADWTDEPDRLVFGIIWQTSLRVFHATV